MINLILLNHIRTISITICLDSVKAFHSESQQPKKLLERALMLRYRHYYSVEMFMYFSWISFIRFTI